MNSKVFVNESIIRKEVYYKGQLVLDYTIKYPQFLSNNFQEYINELNIFYQKKANAYEVYVNTKIYNLAIKEYENSVKFAFPIRTFVVFLEYNVTYNENCVISLYFDLYEFTGGAHGRTVRSSDNWDLERKKRIKIEDVFYNIKDCPLYIINKIENQINEQIKSSAYQYFEYYQYLISDRFREKSFYLTHEGVVIYYQEYDIAPYASGILSYTIPYTNHTVKPPRCR